MNVLILGGGGFLGRKLAEALQRRGHLRGREIAQITLADNVPPAWPGEAAQVRIARCDITDPAALATCLTAEVDVIFHLAAVVSAHAEAAFDDGYRINLDGTRAVLERARALGTAPVLVFSSSIAVYGGDVPDPLGDHSALAPSTSYGAQKAMGELLVADYTRKGFIDGRAFRLPTISVRPGKPNRAASSFMSAILREPLNGQEAVCPVDPDFPHYYLSPRLCVENLIRGAELTAGALGAARVMQMPGRCWTIGQLVDAMRAVAGPGPARLIRWEAQPEIRAIVSGWRSDIRADRALALGLRADTSFEDNIRYYLEDDKPAG